MMDTRRYRTTSARNMNVSINNRIVATLLMILLSAFLLVVASPSTQSIHSIFKPVPAYADITVGGETLHGYEPDEIVSTDVNIDASTPEEVPAKAENVLVSIVKIAIPILAIAAVGLIIYNAIRNMFKKQDERVKMGDVVKNIFVNFFFILFAWIIVELIIFVVTNGEALVVATIMS